MEEKAFNHSAHVALWDWLAKNPGTFKDDWPGWEKFSAIDHCFACQYIAEVNGCCEHDCPLLHDHNKGLCLGGIYYEWIGWRYNHEKRSAIAAKIRDLPVKPGVICK